MARDNESQVLTPELAAASPVLQGKRGISLVQAQQGGLHVDVGFDHKTLLVALRRNGDGGLALRFPVLGAESVARVPVCPVGSERRSPSLI